VSFENPLALSLILLALPIIWLYRREARPPRARTATGHLWAEVLGDDPRSGWWRGYRRGVSLGVWLAVLALLVLAAADPHLPAPVDRVVILDTSACMGAATPASDAAAGNLNPPDAKTRLSLAREVGHRLIAGRNRGDRLAVLTAANQPRVLIGWGSDGPALHAAIDLIDSAQGATDLASAVALARGMLDAGRHGEIVVVTDGCLPSGDPFWRMDDVRRIRVGSPADNRAIVRLAARRRITEPERCDVLLETKQFGAATQRAAVQTVKDDASESTPLIEFSLDGRPIAGSQGGLSRETNPARRLFSLEDPPVRLLEATLTPSDALPEDDRRACRIPAAWSVAVRPSGPLSRALRAALEANPAVTIVKEEQAAGQSDQLLIIAERRVPDPLPEQPLLLIGVDAAGLPASVQPYQDAEAEQLPAERTRRTRFARLAGPGGRIAVVPPPGVRSMTAEWPLTVDRALRWLASDARPSVFGPGGLSQTIESFPPEESNLVPPAEFERVDSFVSSSPKPYAPPWTYLVALAALIYVASWPLTAQRWLT